MVLSFENRYTTVPLDESQSKVYASLYDGFDILANLRKCAAVTSDGNGVEPKSGLAKLGGLETSDVALERLENP